MNRIIVEECNHFNNSSFDNNLVVLSTYFSSKPDPVRGGYQNNDNFAYIEHWYNSIVKIGLFAVVFHDNLSEKFIKKYQSDKIRFIRCRLGKMSLNDERFFIFQEFILNLPDNAYVLNTDINDVVINKNPIAIFQSSPSKLFVGRGNRKVWKNGIWTLKSLSQFSKQFNQSLPISFFHYPVFNPGTIGGRKDKMLELFDRMTQVFGILGDAQNYDMPVFNYVLKEFYFSKKGKYDGMIPFRMAWIFWFYAYRIQRKLESGYKMEKYDLATYGESVIENKNIYAGYPFVSMFSWYENPSDAYLIHK